MPVRTYRRANSGYVNMKLVSRIYYNFAHAIRRMRVFQQDIGNQSMNTRRRGATLTFSTELPEDERTLKLAVDLRVESVTVEQVRCLSLEIGLDKHQIQRWIISG